MAAAIAQDRVIESVGFCLFRLFLVGAFLAGTVPAFLLWRNYFPPQKHEAESEVMYGSKWTRGRGRIIEAWWQVRHQLPWLALIVGTILLVIGLASLSPAILENQGQ
jgi:hypothetical protein